VLQRCGLMSNYSERLTDIGLPYKLRPFHDAIVTTHDSATMHKRSELYHPSVHV